MAWPILFLVHAFIISIVWWVYIIYASLVANIISCNIITRTTQNYSSNIPTKHGVIDLLAPVMRMNFYCRSIMRVINLAMKEPMFICIVSMYLCFIKMNRSFNFQVDKIFPRNRTRIKYENWLIHCENYQQKLRCLQ